MIQALIPGLVHPFRFATPLSQCGAKFLSWLPDWLTARDPEAVRGFFHGNASFYDPVVLGAVIGECVMASVWSLIGMALNVTTYAVWP